PPVFMPPTIAKINNKKAVNSGYKMRRVHDLFSGSPDTYDNNSFSCSYWVWVSEKKAKNPVLAMFFCPRLE
ncbi:MAG: hypothetical protein RPU72_00010, partial [Candidatus Sedimenticola sp. (ex Thyasira tokunagai)]